jgi:pimeloyl-ACP methyl ester carboxylesterase
MQTRRIPVNDVELVVAEDGIGGRPLLLAHGFTGAKEDFTDYLALLAVLGWHAVAPD